jgi:hypothetical protein
MNPPFIVTTPIRNEEWILEKFLQTTSLWADHILILDSGCEDQSLEICSRFPKVRILPYRSGYVESEHQRRSDLLHAAREIHPQAIVFTLDADEIISGEILNPATRKNVVDALQSPGSSLALPWVMLWKSPLEYRTESHGIWSDRWMRSVYWDDGKTEAPYEGFLHFPRVPRGFHSRTIPFPLPLLHYQFVAWKRTSIKQAHWRIIEWEKGPQTFLNSLRINLLYAIARETWDRKTSAIPTSWIHPYQNQGIDLSSPIDERYPLFLKEITTLMKRRGTTFFEWLDIWDLPWESYRRELEKENLDKELGPGLDPNRDPIPLNDPRSPLIKIYHHLIHLASYFGSSLALRIYQTFLKKENFTTG